MCLDAQPACRRRKIEYRTARCLEQRACGLAAVTGFDVAIRRCGFALEDAGATAAAAVRRRDRPRAARP